jgi:toxin-antitoxin system PIN domain toxin
MKPCLADVNFLLPLLVRSHVHHAPALDWWSRQPPGRIGLCRIVQLGLVRLLSNQRVMQNHAMTARSAWDVTVELLADERIDFWPEPAGLDDLFPRLLRYSVPTQALVSDAYLAAFAICRQSGVVTLDQGFKQFAGLSVELLESL